MNQAAPLPHRDIEAMRQSAGDDCNVELAAPNAADGAAVHKLISQCKPLDVNSTYAYLLLCHHHADTCVIARQGNAVVGFISGYVLPKDRQTFFVWQVAVHRAARGMHLGTRMLEHLMRREPAAATRFMETTVSPSNTASRRMFQRFADSMGAAISEQALFDRASFGEDDHEEEILLRIGPFDTRKSDEETK